MIRREGIPACFAFAAVLALLLAMDGNRLLPGTNDEGIYLDAAERMLHGQRLYVDFFGVVSPGVFWVQELFFRAFGVTMLAGRLPVLIYFSSECALLFWLTARLTSRSAAWFTLLVFVALQSSDLSFLTAQHRWDSGALALASIAFAVQGLCSKVRWPWVAAGAAGVLAAVFTPSMLLVPAATLAWLGVSRELRPRIPGYLVGAVAVGAATMLVVAASGLLLPFLAQMRWLSQNYSSVNVMAYGATIGGYGNLLEGPKDASLILRALVVFFLALPAILPMTNLAGWAAALWLRTPAGLDPARRAAIRYLLVCSVALVASTYPRPDLAHLAWVAPVPFALAGALVASAVPRPVQAAVVVLGILGPTFFVLHLVSTLGGVSLATPVGKVRVSQESAASVQALLDTVKPGDSAFVHPYKPLLYFLTQTKNPTRYSYLGPGMMTSADEQSALGDLRRAPPQWVMLLRISPGEFLRIFPSGDLSRLRFQDLENWIDAHYAPAVPAVELEGYRLLRSNTNP